MTEKFKIEADPSRKLFVAAVGGSFQISDAGGLAMAFLQEGGKIQSQTSEYTFVADTRELESVDPALLEMLEQAFKMYKTIGFKKLYVVESKSADTSRQIREIAEKMNFGGEFVQSMDEIK
ncbi:hypothetical protein [Saccharibacillus alkalitolerans]|uniref:STAS domain-containing protein n=1 Tax=Saccharibacillus alkalitolerans TaxID=2705290 RepID=A0ABX0F1Z4_9BACL|nr:hypothetical protein [Saccharibacillus alkalitolerans]NGZ75007.1 hypothetical protein [Saccharibacillus alkalitolerans]